MKYLRFIFTLGLLQLGVLHFAATRALAQELPNTAQEAIIRGEAVMEQALQTYVKQYPDLALWRDAINEGKLAAKIAPGRPEPLRFLAEAYSRSNWYGPAYDVWNQFLEVGGELDSEAVPLFSAVASELGYTAYSRKQIDRALIFYQRLVDVVPYDKEGYVWVGRILLETGKPKEAISYWQTVVERDVTDERAKYFLKLAQSQSQWGIDAANAFEEGIVFYNQKDLGRASERFARAVSFNETYAEAWAYLGRMQFEQGNYQDATIYYKEANRLEPSNETYRYFFEESQRR